MNGICTPQRLRSDFGEAEVADFSCVDELLHRPDRFLDRHFWIATVLIVNVDRIDVEPLQRSLCDRFYVLRGAVDAARLTERKAELVAIITWSRRPAMALPTRTSFVNGP